MATAMKMEMNTTVYALYDEKAEQFVYPVYGYELYTSPTPRKAGMGYTKLACEAKIESIRKSMDKAVAETKAPDCRNDKYYNKHITDTVRKGKRTLNKLRIAKITLELV